MFPLHQGALDEVARHFAARYDVDDVDDDHRLHIHEPNVGGRGDAPPAHHQHYHHPTRKRELPHKLRVPQQQEPPQPEESAASGKRTLFRDGRSMRGRRKTSLLSPYGNETPEQRNERLTYMRERRKQRAESESEEQRAARLVESRERTRQKLLAETDEEREKRLKYLRDRQRQRIKSETKEERERRLLYLRERQKERLRNETLEQRQKRLSRSRDKQHTGKRGGGGGGGGTSTTRSTPEPEGREETMYIRDSQCQVILTEPQHPPEAERDPLDLRDYQNREQQRPEENRRRLLDNAALTIGHVWSLKPNTGVDDKLWYHNQL